MATSIVDLEEGYFRALHEVIMETKRALRDVSCIDAHYVCQVVTVMSSWQEAVQTAASHMEGIDTTIYLARHKDMQKVTREYVVAVVKAREEHNAAHTVEEEAWRQALKDNDYGDPVVRLLHITRTAACTQCEKAVDAFLSSIKKTLQKHMPMHAHGPLISNALSTAFQFQMSVWCMIGKECICLVRAKHSDWCDLASIVQAIVKTFPKNCALMFPLLPPPLVASFSTTFRPQLSDDDDNNDAADNYGAGSSFHRFDSSLLAPTEGTLAEQVTPTCPLPYFMGEPSVYQLTPRSHPVALSARLQMTMRNVAHSWVMTIWTWGIRPMTREMARRIPPVTRPYPTPPSLSYDRR